MGTEATWTNLSLSSEKLEAIADDTAAVVSALETTVGAISKLLQKIASLLQFGVDFISNIVQSLLAYIINVVEDTLNTGVLGCVHSNLKYDPDHVVSDWFSDGRAPFTANGLPGWLYEVALSSQSVTNPFAPRPDNDQPMGAIVITKGVNIDALDSLAGLINSATALTDLVSPNSPLSLLTSSAKGYGAVWKERIGTEEGRGLFRMGSAETPVDTEDPTISEQIGEYLSTQGSAISQKFGSEAPFPRMTLGQPAWFSAKLSDVLGDPISDTLRQLQKLVDQFSTKESTPLIDLLNAISRYLDSIAAVLGRLSDFIGLLDDFINTLASLDFCIVPIDSSQNTGMPGLVSRILTAENVPDYGANGVVFGMMIGFQGADYSGFQAASGLFKFLGFDFEGVLQNYKDQYKQAWTDMTSEVTDAWASTALVNKAPEWVNPVSFQGSTPVFSFNVVTDTTSVGTITAQSLNTPASSVTYSITGGTDQFHSNGSLGVISQRYEDGGNIFTINSTTGALSFVSAPDYTHPTASTAGNVYTIEVTASDPVEGTVCLVEVTVTAS